jgi:hypothetical protein
MKTESQTTFIRKPITRGAGFAIVAAIAITTASLVLFSSAEAQGQQRRGVVAGCAGGTYCMPTVGDEVVVTISAPPTLSFGTSSFRASTTLDLFVELDIEIDTMPRRTLTFAHEINGGGQPEQFTLKKTNVGWDMRRNWSVLPPITDVFADCQPPIPPGANIRRIIVNVSTAVENLPKDHPGALGSVQLFGADGEPKCTSASFRKLGEF